MKVFLLLIFTFGIVSSIPFSANKNDNSGEQNGKDPEVQQLKNLKEKSKSVLVSKDSNGSPSATVNEHAEAATIEDNLRHVSTHDRVTLNGQTMKDVEANIDESLTPKHSHFKRSSHRFKFTPQDMAAYIDKTGDEEGVSITIRDLINNQLMSNEEALDYIREIRDQQQYLNNQPNKMDDYIIPSSENNKDYSANPLKLLLEGGSDSPAMPNENDYDNLLDRVKLLEDYESYAELSIQDVIYQLSRIIFKQALLLEGEIGPEKALKEITHSLNKEADKGYVPSDLEKKVLDVVLGSLMDTLTETDMLVSSRPFIGGSKFKLTNEDLRFLNEKASEASSNKYESLKMEASKKSSLNRETKI